MDLQTRTERNAAVTALAKLIRPLLAQAGVHMACVILAFDGPEDGATFVVSAGAIAPRDFINFVDVLPKLAGEYRAAVSNNDGIELARIGPDGPGD